MNKASFDTVIRDRATKTGTLANGHNDDRDHAWGNLLIGWCTYGTSMDYDRVILSGSGPNDVDFFEGDGTLRVTRLEPAKWKFEFLPEDDAGDATEHVVTFRLCRGGKSMFMDPKRQIVFGVKPLDLLYVETTNHYVEIRLGFCGHHDGETVLL